MRCWVDAMKAVDIGYIARLYEKSIVDVPLSDAIGLYEGDMSV